MTIGSVVTHGFGAPGSAALVVTRGYSLGVATDANPYYTAEPPPTLRVDFYNNLTGAKLNVPPLANDVILGCNYQHKIGTIGTFTLQVAADCDAAQNAISGRRIWIYDGNYPVFKGVIRTREISVSSDGKLVLTLVGPSIADQLIGLTTGRGLVFEDDSLTTVVTSLVADTDFDPGSIDTATITARRFDGRTKWDALVATAQAVDCSIREDILPATPLIDMGIFGASTGITLRNFPASSESLSANPYMKQIASLKVKAQSLDLCNRVVPWGQLDGLGGSQLNLGYVAPGNTALTTRLYLNRQDNENDVAPTVGSTWESTSAQRWRAWTDHGTVNIPEAKQTAATANDAEIAQFSYGPLGAQTLGGTVKAQFIGLESGAAVNSTLQMLIRVVSPDGLTVRGTALAHGTYGNELNTTARNVTFPATALSAIAVEAGDWLVIEVGARHGTSGTSTLYIGNSGTVDLPEDETTTDITYLPWIEFSQYIALGTELPTGAEYEVQTGTGPDGNPYYYIEDTASQEIYGIRERWVQFKDILPLGLTNLDFAAASTTLLGMAITYLKRHLAEQVAYEVDVMALRHVNPNTGQPYFKVGDTFRLQFDGWTQDSAGARNSYLNVDTDLYVLDFTVTYDSAGTPVTKLTLSTFLRALPTDGEAFRALAQAVGIEQVAPVGYVEFAGTARISGDGFGMVATDSGDALGSIPTGAAMEWFKDAFTGNKVGEIGAGYSTPSPYTLHNVVMRAMANIDGANAKVGVWDESTGDWAMGIAVQDSPALGDLVSIFKTSSGQTVQTSYAVFTFTSTTDAFLSLLRGGTARQVVVRGGGSTLTIATDAITVTEDFHTVDTEAAAATDNVSTISGGVTGQRVVFKAANSARDVVFTEVGNIKLAGGTFTLNNVEDTIELIYDGTNWLELGRNDNGA